MTTHVIILAQGQQSRLPDLTVPKQMLELPACGDVAIIERTLCQLALLGRRSGPCACYRCVGDGGHHGACTGMMVTVVCGGPMVILLPMVGAELVRKQTGVHLNVGTHQLADPGNSSLKGISRYLDDDFRERFAGVEIDQTVVLLGDVVYSWAALSACMGNAVTGLGRPLYEHLRFVGTTTLSPSLGELWGLSWQHSHDTWMREALAAALEKHPPFHDTYQPGQLRRWLWALDDVMVDPLCKRGPDQAIGRPWYAAIDDYTMDVDLPAHIPMLNDASIKAAADDREHGLVWTP